MDDRVLGAGILVGSLLRIGLYFWFVFLLPWTLQVVQASAFIAVSAILAILAWIGYTLAATHPQTHRRDKEGDPRKGLSPLQGPIRSSRPGDSPPLNMEANMLTRVSTLERRT